MRHSCLITRLIREIFLQKILDNFIHTRYIPCNETWHGKIGDPIYGKAWRHLPRRS